MDGPTHGATPGKLGAEGGTLLSRGLARHLASALLVLMVVAAGVAMTATSDRIVRSAGWLVRGSYPATVEVEGQPATDTRVDLPRAFLEQGLPARARVTWHIPVVLPDTPDNATTAVFVHRARHVLRLRWDGTELAHHGTAEGLRVTHAREGSLLALVPAELGSPGAHTLDLDVVGDWGDGAVLGEVVVGALTDLVRLQAWREQERLGLAIVGISWGIFHVAVAARRPRRTDHFWFGIALACLAAYLFANSETWYAVFGDDASIGPRMRVRRSALMGLHAALTLLGSGIAFERAPRVSRAILAAATGLGLVAAFAPDLRWNTAAHRLGDLVTLAVAGWLLASALFAVRRRRPGARPLLAAVLLAGGAGVAELLVARGILVSSPLFVPGMLAFLATLGAGITLRGVDAEERFARVFEQGSDGIVLVAREGHVLAANPAAAAMLPCLAHPDAHAHLARARTGGTDRAELSFQLAGVDGTPPPRRRWVESVATRLDDGSVLTLLRDVAERRRKEAARVRGARTEARRQLAGTLAHELNNLLGGALGQVSLVRLQHGEDRALDARMGRAEQSLARAGALGRRLATLARGGAPARAVDPPDSGASGTGAVSAAVPPEVHDLAGRRASDDMPAGRARLRVLVVDDEPLVRDALAHMLPPERFEVTTASRAEEVEVHGVLDVLVTDVVLPGEGGMALADRLQAVHPALAVVLVSGFAPELHADARVTDGAWVVVEKPFRTRAFLEAVERALETAR